MRTQLLASLSLQARERPRGPGAGTHIRAVVHHLGGVASIVVGLIGVAGFVASELFLLAGALPVTAASWCIVLSLSVYGLALGLARLHHAFTRETTHTDLLVRDDTTSREGDSSSPPVVSPRA